MTLIETLTLSVGPAIAKSILKLWLRDSDIANSALGSVVDVIAKKTSDVLAQRRGNREFEAIGEKVAESLLPLFDEFRVDDGEKQAVAIAVAGTLERTPLQPELLALHNLDPTQLATHLLTDLTDVTRDFSESGVELYKRNIHEIAAYVVDIASQLPTFTERSFAEVLKREHQLLDVTNQVLDEVRQIREKIETNTEAAAARFEEEYRRTVVRKLDELELFGVEVSNASRRHRLSVAYVTLSVEQKIGSDSVSTMTIHTALARTKRLIVEGAPGSGKTTLLKWISVQSALRRFSGELVHWNNTVPFFIRLRQLTDGKLPQPQDFPTMIAPMIAAMMPPRWVHRKLDQGRAIVLIDGLDEVSMGMREDVFQWVKDLTETYENSRFVISARPYAINKSWMERIEFKKAELRAMEKSDIDIFIDHWHEAVREQLEDEEAKIRLSELPANLKTTLRQNRSIARLAINPLLCAMLCAIHHDQKQNLPNDRIELYEVCCQMLLVRRDEEREVSHVDYPKMSYREKKMLLAHLAYWMIDNGHSMVEIERVDARLDYHLRRTTQLDKSGSALVRKFFVERSGLLRELHSGMIDFAHRTFQEYLAADAAIDADNIDVLIKHAHDVQWREVVMLAAGQGGKRQRENLIQGLISRGDIETEKTHLLHLLAVSCLKTATELDPKLQGEVQKRLADLVPPQSLTEAEALSSAGELAIPYLQYDKKRSLSTQEIVASLVTLAIIKEESAEAAIAQYPDMGKTVIDELIKTDAGLDAVIHLVHLTSLDLHSANISDVTPLANLTNLTSLDLRVTNISDVPLLANFINLATLNLSYTNISDVTPLTNLINLATLNLSYTKISDVTPLTNLINLTSLSLSCTKISDVTPLANLTNLTSLSLSYTNISDVTPLANLTNLTSLNLSSTSDTDVTPLANLTNLTSLDLRYTKISDVTPLINLIRLASLDLRCTKISDVTPLANLTNLTYLDLSYTNVSDVSMLSHLKNLKIIGP